MIASLIELVYIVIFSLIMIRMVLSWVMPYGGNEFSRLIYQLTEPMLKPFRAVIPLGNMGGIDIAPLVLFLILNIVRNILITLVT